MRARCQRCLDRGGPRPHGRSRDAARIVGLRAGSRIRTSDVIRTSDASRYAGGSLPLSLGDTREPCVNEARRTLYGTIAALGCFELDPLIAVRKADHKERQLAKAAEYGLDVPATLFSNEPRAVRAWR